MPSEQVPKNRQKKNLKGSKKKYKLMNRAKHWATYIMHIDFYNKKSLYTFRHLFLI